MFRLYFFCSFFLFCNFIFSQHGDSFGQTTNSRYTKTLNDSVFVIGDIILVTCIDYKFGSANPNSEDSIKKLISFFEKNPYLIVEISVHSDARGDSYYNQDLCRLRAQILVKVLLESDSLFEERLIPVGKGESDPIYTEEFINQHLDDPELVETYHQKNRRTEIKIIGLISKQFYINQTAASKLGEVIYFGSHYEDLIFVADKALLDGDYNKAMIFYERAADLAPVNEFYAIEQYRKLVELMKAE